jgi:hypothetical protein
MLTKYLGEVLMKEVVNEAEIKVVFKNDEQAMNKLMNFIINKILENYNVIGEMLNDNNNSHKGKGNGRDN